MLKRFVLKNPSTGETRPAFVWLPAGYSGSRRRYPVLYMFDGHNLFSDEDAAFGKSWGLADYMERTGTPLIIAALAPGEDRMAEYSPFTHESGELGPVHGLGRSTLSLYTDVFKPLVDRRWRTLPGRETTFVAGSSMGGLMSLYAATNRSDVFSAACCLSPSLWVHPGKVLRLIRRGDFPPHTMIYLDYGALEMDNHEDNWRALTGAALALLERECDLTFRIVPGGDHSEASWETRVPVFMKCLGF